MNIRATSTFRPGNFAKLEAILAPKLITATKNACDVVVATAKVLVPVDTGELQSSIGSSVALKGTTVTGTVLAAAPHAAFIEFGTGLVGAASDHGALPSVGVPITGAWIYDYKRQGWIGMPARPYLRPAIDTNHTVILDCFAAEGFTVK
jgi:HK97 gp10 family phage protein